MIQADMHMHTWFSTDSEACPRDMADEAVRKGLKTICFTDHFDKDDLEWGEEGIFDVDAYFVEMQKLQEEYAGKLNIRIGIELGPVSYTHLKVQPKLMRTKVTISLQQRSSIMRFFIQQSILKKEDLR